MAELETLRGGVSLTNKRDEEEYSAAMLPVKRRKAVCAIFTSHRMRRIILAI